MFLHSFVASLITILANASPDFLVRQDASDFVQKKHFEGKKRTLLTIPTKDLPFAHAVFFRVIDPGSPGRGWRVFRDTQSAKFSEVKIDGSLTEFLDSIAEPLNAMKKENPNATEARKIARQIISLYSDLTQVSCSEGAKGEAVKCTLKIPKGEREGDSAVLKFSGTRALKLESTRVDH